MVWPASEDAIWDPDTGVEAETLKTIAKASVKVPDGFVRELFIFYACLPVNPGPSRKYTRGYNVMSNTVSNLSIQAKGSIGLQQRCVIIALLMTLRSIIVR